MEGSQTEKGLGFANQSMEVQQAFGAGLTSHGALWCTAGQSRFQAGMKAHYCS
jgi:hypothetical protein